MPTLDFSKIPPPDAAGHFLHPDLPDDPASWKEFLDERGLESRAVFYANEKPEHMRAWLAARRRFDFGFAKDWSPVPPDGDGWARIGQYECEEGPAAIFVRPAR